MTLPPKILASAEEAVGLRDGWYASPRPVKIPSTRPSGITATLSLRRAGATLGQGRSSSSLPAFGLLRPDESSGLPYEN